MNLSKPFKNLSEKDLIYNKVYSNSLIFLRRSIKELVSNKNETLDHEQAVVSCIFIQMAIELGLKAYLIKNKSLDSILQTKSQNKNIKEIYIDFEDGELKTKRFDQLKDLVIKEYNLFDEDQIYFINLLQVYRNQAVHFNLRLERSDLYDLKYDLIYVLIHVIIPILTEINMDFETPSEFYENNLDKDDFKALIKYEPYVLEMEKVAANHSSLVYNCIECNERTYSVDNEMCYCCNLQFSDAGEYITCIACEKPRSLIFDHLNIQNNDNIAAALCLNCNESCQVFKCPKCDLAIAFYEEWDLIGSCFTNCELDIN